MTIDLTPDTEEIVQAEDCGCELSTVPVDIKGPVQTRELPAIRAGYKTDQGVTALVGVRLLPFEPRRKSALIMASDQDIWISSSQAGAQSGASGAFRVAVNVAFPIDHMDEVWACTITGTSDISVMSSFWSE